LEYAAEIFDQMANIRCILGAKIPKKIMEIFVAFGQYKDDGDPLVVIWKHVYQ